MAVERAQEGLLAAVLDAARVDLQPERAGERADRLDDGLALLAAADTAHQLGVELEGGEREAAQARDGRQAAAEVVDRQAHAGCGDAFERGGERRAVEREHLLVEVELQPIGLQPGRAQRGGDAGGKVAAHQLFHRDIHRETQARAVVRRRPVGGVVAGRGQHPVADVGEQAGIADGIHELAVGQQAELGVAPAQQGLAGTGAAGARIDQRLEVQGQLVGLQGVAQAAFELAAVEAGAVEAGVEGAAAVAAEPARLLERALGVAQQGVEVAPVLRIEGEAGAGGDALRPAAELEGFGDRAQQAVGELLGAAREIRLGQQHDEAVAALARHQGLGAGRRCEPSRDAAQGFVAGALAQAAIDRGEAVEVEAQDRDAAVTAGGAHRAVAEARLEHAAVGQAGERVVAGQVHRHRRRVVEGARAACRRVRRCEVGAARSVVRAGRGRAEDDGVDAGPQPWRAVELERAQAAIGEGEVEAAAALALDQQARARGEEGLAVGEEVGERTPGDVAVVAAEQAAGRAVGVEHDLVAGDEQALVEQLEQGEVDAGLCALRKVRNEGFGRGGAGGGWQARQASGRVHDGVAVRGGSVQAPRVGRPASEITA